MIMRQERKKEHVSLALASVNCSGLNLDMKRIYWSVAMALLVACSALAQSGSVSAELSLDQEQYLPGEDVVVELKIYNRSGQTVELGADKEWVTFTIQSEDKKTVDTLADMPVKGAFSLRPSEMASKRLNLTPYFAITPLGRYHVVATINITQWNEAITSKGAFFSVIGGSPLPGFPDMEFGVPPPAGLTNVTPIMRRYALLKNTMRDEIRLYFQLKDATGKPIKTFPIGRMVSFAQPEERMDASSRLHVLTQYGAKSFGYVVLDPDGNLVLRQTHDFTQTRPALRIDSDGRVYIAGGVRRVTPTDLPKPSPTVIPANTNVSIP